jgi:uncharacterized protein (TIGR03083 family)
LGPHVETLAREGTRFLAAASRQPLDTPLPGLAPWRLEELVAHLGSAHRWAAGVVRTRELTRPDPDARPDGPDLLPWFEVGLAELVDVLDREDPDVPCPAFGRHNPQTVGFWMRRQAHETTIHRWDAESPLGVPGPIGPALATDGIDELLQVFTRARGGQVLRAPLLVATTDTGAAWLLTPTDEPGRVDVVRDDGLPVGPAAVDGLHGNAEQVLLALWHRHPVDGAGLRLEGDDAAVRAFVSGPLGP